MSFNLRMILVPQFTYARYVITMKVPNEHMYYNLKRPDGSLSTNFLPLSDVEVV
jgi:hypothetical protein